ncbi:MAG TPA: hypothetical protein VFH85_00575 [Gammaproteobacteria bacterium]|nr:hypothetical protein [Gammaproteobacteria bacterium]
MFFLLLLTAVGLLSSAASAAAIDPQSALQIARTGAATLALKQVDAGEAAVDSDSPAWARWERARIEIYQTVGNRQAVIDRVADLSSDAPADLRAWALTQAAEAELALGHGAAARKFLRQRLQMPVQQAGESVWRQVGWLMIRSFVIEGRLNQAMSMMEAQRTQYPNAPAAILDRLEARIELLQDQPAQAFELLESSDDPHAQSLKWLAGLRAGKMTPADVEKQAQAFAAGGHAPADRRAALIVAAEAALDDRDPVARVAFLEQALTIPATVRGNQSPFDLDSDDVWQVLLGLGQTLAHQRKLDADDAAALLAAAAAEKQPIEAQALVVLVALGRSDASLRVQAQAHLCRLLADQPRGDDLLRQLYLHSQQFASLASVPVPVRRRLASDAIDAGEMTLAAKLLTTLDDPPADGDAAEWQLERSRAFILTGKVDAGVAAIESLLESGAVFSFDDLQPSLFALQAIGRHQDAIRIFRQLLSREPPPAVRQKLLYWLGESYAALGKHTEAAKMYLQSATLDDTASMDRWAQTARYQAAGALAKAGFIADARRVYQRLLNASRDPARRAALRQKITELH